MVNNYKLLFIIFLKIYIEMVNKYYKKTKKSLEKKHVKGTKVFLSNKRTKAKKKKKMLETDIKIFLRKIERKESVSS